MRHRGVTAATYRGDITRSGTVGAMKMNFATVPGNALGSLAFVALDRSLMQRGIKIELFLPIFAQQLEAAVLGAISLITDLWTAARHKEVLQAIAFWPTLKVV